ncbi:MAG: helicase-related protein, partial [Candidatus Phytoplasma pyri]
MKKLLPHGGIVFYFVPWISLLEQSSYYFNDNDILIIPICSKEKEILKKDKDEDIYETNIMDFSNFLYGENWEEKKKDYKYIIFFCTYQSHQRIAIKQKKRLLPLADLMICDEAHHTTYEAAFKKNQKEKNLFESLHKEIKSKKFLFMTATVKICYKNKNKKNYIDMHNKDIYGDIFYSLDLGNAIKKNILCDYNIIYTYLSTYEEAKEINSKLNEQVQQKMNELGNQYRQKNFEETKEEYLYEKNKFLTQERLNNITKMVGIYKAIQKCNQYNGGDNYSTAISFVNAIQKNRAKKASIFMESIIKYLNSDPNFILNTDYIEGKMNTKDRQEKLDKLINKKPFLLWNCRCLTEGVDIPSCDTVIFFDSKNSSLEITQAIGRVLRKDPNNPNKKANIILLNFKDDEHSLIKNISLDNKDFLNTLEYILINDVRFFHNDNEEELEEIIKDKIKYLIKNENNSLKPLKGKILNDYNYIIKIKDQEKIDFLKKFIKTKKIKSGFSWKFLVSKIKKTLEKIQHMIVKESQNGSLEEIKKMFGTILKIDETFLKTQKTSEILAQYILFYPILEKIYKVKCSLFQELDQLLKNLGGVLGKIKEQAQKTIDEFICILEREYEDINDKEHIFTQIYNDLLKSINPDLSTEYGMWYTPGWVVKILWDILLHLDNCELNTKDKIYHVIDPASGTGSFITHFIKNILKKEEVIDKFYDDYLHIREIHFISFMISVFRIAIAAKKTKTPKNIHWGDTLKNESKDKNPIAIQHKGHDNFTVIITNPPWRKGQTIDEGKKKLLYKKENLPKLLNKEKEYWVDNKIVETFVKLTDKHGKQSLYNMYRRFVRWSLDHIKTKGWIAMVLPNSFLTESVEGFRRSLTNECQKIYLVNLRGAQGARVSFPEKEGDNIFLTETQNGNQQGVVLLLCFKDYKGKNKKAETYYHVVPDNSLNNEKND